MTKQTSINNWNKVRITTEGRGKYLLWLVWPAGSVFNAYAAANFDEARKTAWTLVQYERQKREGRHPFQQHW
jgi:hypothetical protein